MNKPLRLLDTFSGIGGFSLARVLSCSSASQP